MLIKEYRIALPMSVEEYRIAQLYMIQKKSREESSGTGSGVEILQNEPYEDGPGGKGQYTYKIYHIGSHLPGWFRAILPKSALRVEEEAWNAYPYTRTIYRCPFIEKFMLEIETVYVSDGGEQDNIFNLSNSELRNRIVDYLDIVKDPIPGSDYRNEEDPKLFMSHKTKRGPLSENWRLEYIDDLKDVPDIEKGLMCAYKLCKVEFKYWGMQSKIERFIHDIGLRKTMLRAHRQAWCWQDEYYGLTIEDIRELERETQLALQEKMAALAAAEEGDGEAASDATPPPSAVPPELKLPPQDTIAENSSTTPPQEVKRSHHREHRRPSSSRSHGSRHSISGRKSSMGSVRSRKSLSGHRSSTSNHDLAKWRVESIEKLQTSSSDEEEFFDAQEGSNEQLSLANASLYKSSSIEMLTPEEEFVDMVPSMDKEHDMDSNSSPLGRRVEQYRHLQQLGASVSLDLSLPATPTMLTQPSQLCCKTTLLFLIIHGGSIMDSGHGEAGSKHSDISTLKATMESVIRAHYPDILGHIAWRLVSCPHICADTLKLLASLSPFSSDFTNPSGTVGDSSSVPHDTLPLGAIPLFATGNPDYSDAVAKMVNKTNQVYHEFLRSEDGLGFNGQVCLIGDSVGSIMTYDALCKHNPHLHGNSRYGSHEGLHEEDVVEHQPVRRERSNLETIKQVSMSNPDLNNLGNGTGSGSSQSKSEQPNEHRQVTHTQSAQRAHSVRAGHGYQQRHASCPNSRRTSTGSNPEGRFDFETTDFFMFGAPLAIVMAYRKLIGAQDQNLIRYSQYLDPLSAAIRSHLSEQRTSQDSIPRPLVHQMYNLFYASDPSASRIEPLLCDRFRGISPLKICRYQKFPLGDGQTNHMVDTIQNNTELFVDLGGPPSPLDPPAMERRQSNMSILSQMSGQGELSISSITSITSRWWGTKRLDYALYCPDALQSFPATALPYLLHASFWESSDVAAFVLRQVIRQDYMAGQIDGAKGTSVFKPNAPREKWLKRRTTIKLRNVAPNHRANDVICLEEKPQVLSARFMYGPLDMVCLSGEKVDVHVMTSPTSGEWVYFGTEVTDGSGRCVYRIPPENKLPQGMYPVKMVVRGDHTSVDFFLTVLPPKTECVLFSIDGSFTASVSIMGKDPKVRAGAVDVVRHWQELGFLILYVTARPDMQQKKVVAWLAQHNFPHGMVCFMDGISADPIRQKMNFLRNLAEQAGLQVHAGYGSSKDIAVYQGIGLPASNIFIVGKVSKKLHKEANVLLDGYAAHLGDLVTHNSSRPAIGNARLFIHKGCFSLPGQMKVGNKKSIRKTVSLPQRGASVRGTLLRDQKDITVNEAGNTVVDPGLSVAGTAARPRGTSPRVKVSPFRYESSNV